MYKIKKKYSVMGTIDEYISRGTTGSSLNGWARICYKGYQREVVTLGTGS